MEQNIVTMQQSGAMEKPKPVAEKKGRRANLYKALCKQTATGLSLQLWTREKTEKGFSEWEEKDSVQRSLSLKDIEVTWPVPKKDKNGNEIKDEKGQVVMENKVGKCPAKSVGYTLARGMISILMDRYLTDLRLKGWTEKAWWDYATSLFCEILDGRKSVWERDNAAGKRYILDLRGRALAKYLQLRNKDKGISLAGWEKVVIDMTDERRNGLFALAEVSVEYKAFLEELKQEQDKEAAMLATLSDKDDLLPVVKAGV